MTLTETIAGHFATCTRARIPDDAAAAAKRLLLDTMAVAWAGADAPGGAAIRDLVTTEGGRPESTVWVFGDRLPATAAAFLNGVSAAALDYDSVYEAGSVHPEIVIVPACWAMAEREGRSGRDLIAAIALGTDLMCRLGKATRRNTGWFYTALYGAFGAAAASARLLGLDANGIADALGLALARTGGTQQALVEKTIAKRLQSAFMAREGVFAALLAKAGASGPRQALEGTYGLYKKYDDGDPDVLMAGLGQRFENVATAIKKYPSCTANHPPVEAAIAIAREFDLVADDVVEVEVALSPLSHRLVGGPFDPGANPQVAAQFSIQYSIACALLRRRLAIADIQDDAVRDPAVGRLAAKVRAVADETNKGKFAPATVTVVTRRHGTIRREAPHVPGTLEFPLGESELHAKVLDCLAAGPRPLVGADAERLIARLRAIEDVGDMGDFFAGMKGAGMGRRAAGGAS